MRNRTKSNNRRRPAWVEMFAKTRNGAEAVDGRDWHTDVPNIKLSRAFVVVLVLHVVAVGGILAFEMFKPDATIAEVDRSAAKTQLTADTPAAPAPEQAQAQPPAVLREADRGGYESYIVQPGDSIRKVAARYDIARTDLLNANRIDEQHPLVAGRLLRIPKALLPGGSSANLQHVSAESSVRPGTPALESSIGASEPASVLPIPEPIQIAEDDGFTPLITPPVSPTPTPEPVEEPTARQTADSGYQPVRINSTEENAPVTIVAPRPTSQPRVVRKVPTTTSTPKPAASGRSHRVAAGETLYAISRKFGVSVDAILSANPGVKPSTLGIGKTLRIP